MANRGELRRVIEGQSTKLARSVHNIRYDPIHDEILVGNPVAQAILVFRGGATGDEEPIRVIQGPRTMLWDPDHVDVDPVHNEIFVPDGDRVLVFAREAHGNVAPIRIIQGPHTRLVQARGIAVDPVHEVIIVSEDLNEGTPTTDIKKDRGAQDNGTGLLLIFKRTDSGNVKPRAVIGGGPNARLHRVNEFVVSPKGWIVVPPSAGGGALLTAPGQYEGIGIWSINDSGDVPPRWILAGPQSKLKGSKNAALNPAAKELIVMMEDGGFAGYHLPEIF